jgi:hypothetical protein
MFETTLFVSVGLCNFETTVFLNFTCGDFPSQRDSALRLAKSLDPVQLDALFQIG